MTSLLASLFAAAADKDGSGGGGDGDLAGKGLPAVLRSTAAAAAAAAAPRLLDLLRRGLRKGRSGGGAVAERWRRRQRKITLFEE